MKVILALFVGIALGVAVVWFYGTSRGRSSMKTTGDQIESATKSARDSIQDKMRSFNLRPEDIKEDLAKTGQVVRRKAQEAGRVISDATADARITAAIKGKFVASKDLSAMSISVNTTEGNVTLSGSVNSPEDIGKAMTLALETDGVREVVSTMLVTSKKAKE